jgi:hypothetical protein
MAWVFSWIDSIWGPDLEAKTLSIFFRFREVFLIFRGIPAVGYSEDSQDMFEDFKNTSNVQ